MSTVTKRIVSSLYWLAGAGVAIFGMAVGFLVGFFMSGYKTSQGMHRDSIDIWDSKHNDHD